MSVSLQSLFTSSPFSDPLNVNMAVPNPLGSNPSWNGRIDGPPSVSKIDANNMLTIVVSLALGTCVVLILILLIALHAKR